MKTKINSEHWLVELIIGVLLLLPSCLLYLFLFIAITDWPFPECQDRPFRSYTEELTIIVFGLILTVWILILSSPSKRKLHITSVGSIIIIGLIILSAIGGIVKREPFYKEYDAIGWKVHDYPIYSGPMARQLVKDNTLIGKTRQEITLMLGENTHYRGYTLDTDNPRYLVVKYDNSDVVNWVHFECNDWW